MDESNRLPATDHRPPTTGVAALAGGVGGAKLADGLQAVLPAGALDVVVNTADDFKLWGLHISPDIDTVMYTLAGLANPETGWGVSGIHGTLRRCWSATGATPGSGWAIKTW